MPAGRLTTYNRLDYESAWSLQRELVEERMADRCLDTLLLMEHGPVFTIGRSGQEAHWGGDEQVLREAGFPVYRVERGGSITYHGPGQIVGYPILRLDRYCAGPKAYVQRLEEVLSRTLTSWGIEGHRVEGRGLTGVWVGSSPPEKIAALGVRIQRGVTMHGFALNVDMDLTPFSRIVPCGIVGCHVTSMAEHLGGSVDRRAVRQRMTEVFAEVFGLVWADVAHLESEINEAVLP